MRILKCASVCFMCFILKASAQNKSTDTTARYFIIQASISNLQEVALAKLALQKSPTTAVKDFATKMISDHNNSEMKLLQLVKANGIQIPHEATDTPPEDIVLKNLSPEDFDKLYVHMMVADHASAVQLFQNYSIMGKNESIKDFASQTLPTLKDHLAMITSLNNKISMTGSY